MLRTHGDSLNMVEIVLAMPGAAPVLVLVAAASVRLLLASILRLRQEASRDLGRGVWGAAKDARGFDLCGCDSHGTEEFLIIILIRQGYPKARALDNEKKYTDGNEDGARHQKMVPVNVIVINRKLVEAKPEEYLK